MTNKKELKTASRSGKEFIAENREIFQKLEKIENGVEKILEISGKKTTVLTNQDKKEKNIKIVSLEVQEDKLIAQLSDGRGAIIPIEWFTKWGVKNITASKLKNYEIWRGKNIHFIDINEVLGIEKFIHGFNADCE